MTVTDLARLNSTTLAARIAACDDLPAVAGAVLEPLRQLVEADSAVFLQFRHDCGGHPLIGENAYVGRQPASLSDYTSGFFTEDPIFVPVMSWSDRWHQYRDPILCHLSDSVPLGVLKNTHYFRAFLRPYDLGDVIALALPVDIDGPQLLCVGLHREFGRDKFGEIHCLALNALAQPLRSALSNVCLRSTLQERNVALGAISRQGSAYAVFDDRLRILSASAELHSRLIGTGTKAERNRTAVRAAVEELSRHRPGDSNESVAVDLPDGGRCGRLQQARAGCDPRFVLTVDDSVNGASNRPQRGSLPALTGREREVARLVGAGYRNREIATDLGISVRTVENHLRAIFEKLGVDSRAQLISRLYREHIVQ